MTLRRPPSQPKTADEIARHDAALWFVERAQELQQARQLDRAVVCFKRSLELYPTVQGHAYLGLTYSAQGRFNDAVRECERALAIDATSLFAIRYLNQLKALFN